MAVGIEGALDLSASLGCLVGDIGGAVCGDRDVGVLMQCQYLIACVWKR